MMDTTIHKIEMALYYAGDDPAKLKEIVEDLKARIEADEFDSSDAVRAELNAEIEDLRKDNQEDLQKEEEKTARMEKNRDLWWERAEKLGYEVPGTPFNVHNFKTAGSWAPCHTLCHAIEGESWMDDRIVLTPKEAKEIAARIEEVCGDEESIAQILGEYWDKIPKDRRVRFDRKPVKKGKRK